jgi:hypothetical protein
VFEPGDDGHSIIGRGRARGWPTSCTTGAIWSSTAWTARPTTSRSAARDELANYHRRRGGGEGIADVRAADKNIAALASDGLYRTDHHLAIAQGQAGWPRPAGSRRGPCPPAGSPAPRRHRGARGRGLWKVPATCPSVAASTTRSAWAAWPWS